jgi:glucosamine--fructose-6-phosphate aminotransferase (isomerizing)
MGDYKMYDTSKSQMWKEIFEQPQAVENAVKFNMETIKSIAAEVKKRKINTVVFAARGSSEHACQVGKYLFEIYCGMTASIASPSVITSYEVIPDYSNILLIGVSQSGGAQDVYETMKACENQGGVCVSITNVRDSLMTRVGSYYMNCECGPELSVTAAKSYITQLAIISALAAYISDNNDFIDEILHLKEIVSESLLIEDQIRKIIPLYRNASNILIFGRGLLYALGLETELKIQETSYLDARCYASSDYQHGPIAATRRFIPTIFFIADNHTNDSIISLYNRLKKEYKIFSTVVTNNKNLIKDADEIIELPTNHEGLKAVFSCTVFSQMFSCLLSIARGYNPDAPEGVSKKTVTR